jgi:hypothetical protein
MVHSGWHGYHRRLGASEWHQLFNGVFVDGQQDNRFYLTWRGRFGDLPTEKVNVFSFYSTGEDVLASFAGNGPTFKQIITGDFGRNSWVIQEKWKGRWPFDHYGGSKLMGWGFNYEDYFNWTDWNQDGEVDIDETSFLSPAEANGQIDSNDLRTKPFFRKLTNSQEEAKLLMPGSEGSEYAKVNRPRLLGLAIQALTTPTGGWKGETMSTGEFLDRNNVLNMNEQKNGWPEVRKQDTDWWHSDIRNVSYQFIYKVVNKIVEFGGLQ